MLILDLLGMYFDAAVVFFTKSSPFFRMVMAMLCSTSLKNNMFYLFIETLKCTHFFPFQYNHKHILTACQDRNVRVYMVGNGKHIKTFKGSVGEDGTLIKVVLDRSGVYLGESKTKFLQVYF